jgi:hypothetical protein
MANPQALLSGLPNHVVKLPLRRVRVQMRNRPPLVTPSPGTNARMHPTKALHQKQPQDAVDLALTETPYAESFLRAFLLGLASGILFEGLHVAIQVGSFAHPSIWHVGLNCQSVTAAAFRPR